MEKIDLCIENGRIFSGGKLVEAGIGIDDGKIVSVSKKSSLPKAEEKIDAEKNLVMPGVVDVHVHFRDPGRTDKEDFYTGSRAAAAGGVTTVCDMPNTSPETVGKEEFIEKKKIASRKSLIDFGLHGMLTSSIEDGEELLDMGASSLKLFPDSHDDSLIGSFDNPQNMITIHPEDSMFLKSEENISEVSEFLDTRPEIAEVSEVLKSLSYSSSSKIHFCHVTNQDSIRIINKAKQDRKVTSEVTPHHLLLNKMDVFDQGSFAKMNPPLRREIDRKRLLKSLKNGLVDIVATDHAPHTREEKEKDIGEAPPGVPGVETSLPLMFNLVKKDKLSLSRLIEAMCEKPAKIFNLTNEKGVYKGLIKPGADADLTILDHKKEWEINGENLHGKTKFTPFEGKKVIGKPALTMVRGNKIYEKDKIIGEKGNGKFISAEKQA